MRPGRAGSSAIAPSESASSAAMREGSASRGRQLTLGLMAASNLFALSSFTQQT